MGVIINLFKSVLFLAVSRLHCESESFKMDLILDVNTQLYPVDLGKSLDWDSQSLYTAAILENGGSNRGTESKTRKKSERKCRGIPTTTEHAHLCLFCPTRFWLARFKVQCKTRSSHRAVYRASLRKVLYRTAWNPDTLEWSRAWFRSCLLSCTLLKLFVYQSSYLSTLAGAVWTFKGAVMESV